MSSQNENKRSQSDSTAKSSAAKPEPDARISDAEWEVMDLLWDEAPQSSYRIAEKLREAKAWSPKTVKTMLSRLVKKGFLAYEKEANRYLYYPTVTRKDSLRKEGRSFADRLFGGDKATMLLHFVKTTELSHTERDELRAMLDAMDENE